MGPPLGFQVSYIDLPTSVLKTDPSEVLNRELSDRVKATGVELLDKKSITFKECPAVRFQLRYVRGGYFVDGILFLCQAAAVPVGRPVHQRLFPARHEQFFNWFQVVKDREAR